MMHHYPEKLVKEVGAKAQQFRIQVLKMVYDSQSGHLGGAFSCAEIVACLYLHHMRVDPARPDWRERDRLSVTGDLAGRQIDSEAVQADHLLVR